MAANLEGKDSKIAAMFTGKNKLNLVTSESRKTYDPEKNNIGTTFRSGVNIDDPKNAFIIILPYQQGTDKDGFNNQKAAGIFTGGAHEVTQAVARVRNGGVIILVAPVPTHLINGEYLEEENSDLPFTIIDPSLKTDFFPHSDYKEKIGWFYNWWKNKEKMS